jgi:hypothetical protein
MFWRLLLAHLLADYPLQPARLVGAKQAARGRSLHTFIHFVCSWLMIGWGRLDALPKIAALAGLHFTLDWAKQVYAQKRPYSGAGPYFADQFVHIISIAGVAVWINAPEGLDPFVAEPWFVYACALLLLTVVWHVTERILHTDDPRALAHLRSTGRQRMSFRLVFGIFFHALGQFIPLAMSLDETHVDPAQELPKADQTGGLAPRISWLIAPYRAVEIGRRALLTDLTVACVTWLMVRLIVA